MANKKNDDPRPGGSGYSNKIFCGLTVAALVLVPQAQAQNNGFGRTSATVYGGSGTSAAPSNPFPPMPGTYANSHKATDGTACISLHSSVRAQIVNPRIFDQVVIVNNVCGQSIKVQVCYVSSKDCITVPLSGYQKLQRVLGIAANSSPFRYEYRELF